MSALFLLIACSLLAALGFLAMFIWAVRSGQYDDTYTPKLRVLIEDHMNIPITEETKENDGDTTNGS